MDLINELLLTRDQVRTVTGDISHAMDGGPEASERGASQSPTQ